MDSIAFPSLPPARPAVLLVFRRTRLHDADNRPERLRFVVAAEFRRIERRHRAVEEERVLTAEAVPEQPREGVEGDRFVGDGEGDRAAEDALLPLGA